mgnify:CR=1 FL=1
MEKAAPYIEPEEPETDFLRITRPEDIRICDPACGSGNFLYLSLLALKDIATQAGLDWPALAESLKQQGRLHLETY